MALLGAMSGRHDTNLHGHAHGAHHGHGHFHGTAKVGPAAHQHGAAPQAGNQASLPSHHTPQPHPNGNGTKLSVQRAARGGASAANIGADDDFSWKNAALAWLSPRVLFTLALGMGATGLMLNGIITTEPVKAGLALAGGVALEKLAVTPIWNAVMRFGSNPARTLESAVLEEAIALTNFDRDGCGLVTIDLDGHEMRVLGRLAPDERGKRVVSGQTLLVESVDAAREQCVVRLSSR